MERERAERPEAAEGGALRGNGREENGEGGWEPPAEKEKCDLSDCCVTHLFFDLRIILLI